MRPRASISLMSALALVPTTTSAASGVQVTTRCTARTGPSLAQLQAWTREFYPSLVAQASRSSRLVVGYVIDERCAVSRHSVGVLPAGGYSEDVVLTLFTGLTRAGEPAGLAHVVPPSVRGGDGKGALAVAWIMKETAR